MYLRWVQVQPVEGVAIGWMDAASLKLLSGTPGPEPSAPAPTEPAAAPSAPDVPGSPDAPGGAITPPADVPGVGQPTPTAGLTTTTTPTATTPVPTGGPTSAPDRAGGAAPGGTPALVVLPPATPAPAPTLAPVARTVSVSVCRARKSTGPSCPTPIAGARVEVLLAATEEVIAHTATDADGTATLAVSVPTGAALLLRLPAFGVVARVPDQNTPVSVQIPPQLLVGGGAT
jgi:hypothetical protein